MSNKAKLKKLHKDLKVAKDLLKSTIASAKADGHINFIEQSLIDGFKAAVSDIQAEIRKQAEQIKSTENKAQQGPAKNPVEAALISIADEYIQSKNEAIFGYYKIAAVLSKGKNQGIEKGMRVVAGKHKGYVSEVYANRCKAVFYALSERQNQQISNTSKLSILPGQSYSFASFEKAVAKKWAALKAQYSGQIKAQGLNLSGTKIKPDVSYADLSVGLRLPAGFRWANHIKKYRLAKLGNLKGSLRQVFDNQHNRALLRFYFKGTDHNGPFSIDSLPNGEIIIEMGTSYTEDSFKATLNEPEPEPENFGGGRADINEEEAKKIRGDNN